MSINKISIKNFRVFKEKTIFELRPFTILTGPNNSGKSSFTKFLLLLKEGISQLNFTTGEHNLENYDNVLNWKSESKELEFEIEKNKNSTVKYSYYFDGKLDSIKYYEKNDLIFSASRFLDKREDQDDPFENISKPVLMFSLSMDIEYLIKKELLKNSSLESYFYSEETNQLEIYKKGLLYNLIIDNVDETLNYASEIQKIQKQVFNSYKTESNITNIFSDFYDLINEEIIECFLNENKNIVKKALESLLEFKDIEFKIEYSDLWKFMFTNEILIQNFNRRDKGVVFEDIFRLIKTNELVEKVNYLSPNRGNQKRVLMNNSDKDIDSIIVNFSKRKNIQEDFMKKCFSILGIEGELEVNRYENTISTVRLVNNGKKVALADLGFGYSQIIPIILKVHNFLPDYEQSVLTKHRIYQDLKDDDFGFLILEEPEANLHPNLQSKLAELLVYVQTIIKIKFIIETHSEYFIRKLQFLTAKKELKEEDTVIYYFNDDKYVSSKEPKVKEIFINTYGGLTKTFGEGFYDESTRLQFDLIRLQKQQLN